MNRVYVCFMKGGEAGKEGMVERTNQGCVCISLHDDSVHVHATASERTDLVPP